MLAAAVFVGSQACRPCHTTIANSYARTPMARSSGHVAALPLASFTSAGHKLRIEDNRLTFEGGSSSIDYYVGSNSAGRSYLRVSDGYLFELPVTWYSGKQAWDASPGYEQEQELWLTRPVETSCLLCHASQVRPVLGTQNRYGDPPFLEGGVGCERCHGAGGNHVQDPINARMVNPINVDAERRDSICSQCHLSGEARIEASGRRFMEFRAGDRLADFATYFVWKLGRRDLKVTSHVEKLATSACKKASGDNLWCGTCHDTHTNADNSQAACLSCHASAHHRQEQCASCHMPKTRAADALHGVLTDHSIPRVARPAEVPVQTDLTTFLGRGDDRAFGLAWAELGDPRAREFLLRAKPADWPVRLRLAVLEPNPARAAALYESVLRDNPGEPAALVNLGTLRASAGFNDEASHLWERALAVNPGIEQAVLNLSHVRPPAEARAIIRKYLELNPTSPASLARLAVLQQP